MRHFSITFLYPICGYKMDTIKVTEKCRITIHYHICKQYSHNRYNVFASLLIMDTKKCKKITIHICDLMSNINIK